MPGPVSDSYDPEFGTGANAGDVRDGIQEIVDILTQRLGPDMKYIVDVVHESDENAGEHMVNLTERQMRIIRFGLNRALETI